MGRFIPLIAVWSLLATSSVSLAQQRVWRDVYGNTLNGRIVRFTEKTNRVVFSAGSRNVGIPFWDLTPDGQKLVKEWLKSRKKGGDDLEITDVSREYKIDGRSKVKAQFLKVEEDGRIALVIQAQKQLFSFESLGEEDQDYIRNLLSRSNDQDKVPEKKDKPSGSPSAPTRPNTPGRPGGIPRAGFPGIQPSGIPGRPSTPNVGTPGRPTFTPPSIPGSPGRPSIPNRPGFRQPTIPNPPSIPAQPTIPGQNSITGPTTIPGQPGTGSRIGSNPGIPAPSVPPTGIQSPTFQRPTFEPPAALEIPDVSVPTVPEQMVEVWQCSNCRSEFQYDPGDQCPKCRVHFSYTEDEHGNRSYSGFTGVKGFFKLGIIALAVMGGLVAKFLRR